MAGTGKKGYTGVTSDGRVISNGIIQSGGSSSSSSSSGPGGSSNYGARVSAETHENGQPKYVYTSSGKAVPTYGYRVVQGGSDGKLYDINNGKVSPINGGSGSPTQVVGGSSGSSIADAARNAGSAVASALSGRYADSGESGGYDDYGYGGGSYRAGSGSMDPEVAALKARLDELEKKKPGDYQTSAEVNALKSRLQELEGNKPGTYNNAYESQIQSILNGILNKDAFNINTDANYQTLYDLYNQSYQQNANRAARDAMGQLAAMTGGYGNTYAQTAGSQAYDTIMQGMNDNNINLMNLAYNMYRDDLANEYNQLAAVSGLESADYAKYLDNLANYYTDLNYAANRYNTEADRDYSSYRDKVGDYYTDLNYATNRYDTAWNRDYQLNRDEIEDARYADELAFAREQAAQERALAKEALDYERAWNEDQRNYNRSQDAFSDALSLAKQGYNVPDYLSNTMNTYTGSTGLTDLANGIAATVQAMNAPQTSGGGSSSSGGSSRKSSGLYDNGTTEKTSSFFDRVAEATKKKINK